jgi:hypothetical protein
MSAKARLNAETRRGCSWIATAVFSVWPALGFAQSAPPAGSEPSASASASSAPEAAPSGVGTPVSVPASSVPVQEPPAPSAPIASGSTSSATVQAPAAPPSSGAPHSAAPGGPSSEDVKEANNPLSTKVSVNLQNYYVGSLSEAPDTTADTFLLRVSTPFWRILPRFTLPVQTLNTPTSSTSGLGDFNAFVTYLFTNPGSKVELGAGPLYVAPTASHDALGAGKHQLGGALIFLASEGPLLLGSLLQYQASVAGDADRPNTSVLIPQVFCILQIGGGFYLRSSPTAMFNLKAGDYSVPIGAGVGKVALVGTSVVNFFLEPQYTFLSHGPGQPLFQLFAGINTQFKL